MTKKLHQKHRRQDKHFICLQFDFDCQCRVQAFQVGRLTNCFRQFAKLFFGIFVAPDSTLSHASSFEVMSTFPFSQSTGGHSRLKMCPCHGTERNDFPGTCISFVTDTPGTYQFTFRTIRCNYAWRSIIVSVRASFSALSLPFQQISGYNLLAVSTKAFMIHWETRHRSFMTSNR